MLLPRTAAMILTVSLLLTIPVGSTTPAEAPTVEVVVPPAESGQEELPDTDSEELRTQDMLMLLLLPKIQDGVRDYYTKTLREIPLVYPYEIKLLESRRVNGFRGYHFQIKLLVTPMVGPHISVGLDELTFELSPTLPHTAQLIEYRHIRSDPLPPHWQHIIKDGD